jgi:hypothetical protein
MLPPAPAAPTSSAVARPTDWVGNPPVVRPVGTTTSGRPRRSKLLVGGAVAAVVAVGGAGIFAVSNMTGSSVGGAAAPEDLGFALLSAIENEDVLGVIDVLVPGERDALGQPFVETISELQRLEVLGDTDLSKISGLDIELSGEDVQVRTTNVPDIVNIDLRADAVVSIDGADLPIGDLVTDNLPDDMLTELRGTRVTQSDQLDIWLTAVQQDGQWYFSLLHSLAEVGRGELAAGTGIPEVGVGASGADTPEGAVDNLLTSIEQIDLTGLIRSLNPGEAAALQRYAPLFLDDAEAALSELPLSWKISDRSIRVEGSGDTRTAFLDSLAIDGELDGSPFSLSYGDGCVRASFQAETIDQCGNQLDTESIMGLLGDDPAVTALIETIQSAFADVEPAGLELRAFDGKWYVSPIGTTTEVLLKLLRALDRRELDAIIAAFEPAMTAIEDSIFRSFDDLAGSGGFTFPDTPFPDTPFPDTPFPDTPFPDVPVPAATLPAATLPPDDPAGTPPTDPPDEAWLRCYEMDAAGATACFESYVASGDIDRSTIPVVLRHPECGYAELAWSNEIYALPDDEFIAAAESARDCFLALVDSGDVSPYELPSEITNLECFEGRNWYQVFDDPEYDARYYECIGAGFGE